MSIDDKIGVLGCGQMGLGIAQVAAHVGYRVLLADQNLEISQKAKKKLESLLAKQIEKGKNLDQNIVLERGDVVVVP